jgi:tetratricopeptide (TPR) repeat protein
LTLAKAEAIFTQVLQVKEETLGPMHKSTILTVNNLANLCKNQGKLVEAERMYTRALRESEEALGPKHTYTPGTVSNLGNLFFKQGKVTEAEAMYVRALEGYDDTLGTDLALTYIPALTTMLNLGILLSETGENEKARTTYTRALSGWVTLRGLSEKLRLEVVDIVSAETDVLEMASAGATPWQGTDKSPKWFLWRLSSNTSRPVTSN